MDLRPIETSVAIIGAGISAAVLSDHLEKINLDCVLLEKSRGAGGRMSTRRITLDNGSTVHFDLGAQFFTIRDKRCRRLLEDTIDEGLCVPWHLEIPNNNYPGSYKKSERFILKGGMNNLAKYFIKPENTFYETRIVEVDRDNGRWVLNSDSNRQIFSDVLVSTAPAPQSLSLLEMFLTREEKSNLSQISYRPCISLLIASNRELKIPEPGAFWPEAATGIEWICDNFKKGISEVPSMTVHLNAIASEKFLESEVEQIFAEFLPKIQQYIPGEIIYRARHCWRFSQPKNEAWHQGYFLSQTAGPLVICGDAFAGGRVEGALLSGLKAANAIHAEFSTSS